MKRTLTYIVAFTIITAASLPASNYVFANELNEVKEELNELEQEKSNINEKNSDLNSEAKETEEKIEENEAQQTEVTNEINQIDQELAQTQAELKAKETEIENTNKEIKETTEEIEQLKVDIEDLKVRIEKREELLKNRLRTLQQSGGDISYLQVIMGSQSFGDFLNRATAVTKIMDQDKDIMETHAAEKQELEDKQKEVEEKKASLEEKKASLEDQKAELSSLKATLDSQMAEKEKLMEELEHKHSELEDHKMSLEEEQRVLSNQAAIIERAMKEAQQEANKLEQLAKEEAAKQQQQSGGTDTSNNSQPSPGLSAGGSGIFIWPAKGYLSSYFGGRDLGYHYGIDIAAGAGTSIHAAASGVVTRAEYSSSYGYVVYIYHPQHNMTTVYAHMVSSPSVSSGQSVSQGQYIGGVGNTGNSFGNHLHFEVHNGGWSYHGGINPMSYLK